MKKRTIALSMTSYETFEDVFFVGASHTLRKCKGALADCITLLTSTIEDSVLPADIAQEYDSLELTTQQLHNSIIATLSLLVDMSSRMTMPTATKPSQNTNMQFKLPKNFDLVQFEDYLDQFTRMALRSFWIASDIIYSALFIANVHTTQSTWLASAYPNLIIVDPLTTISSTMFAVSCALFDLVSAMFKKDGQKMLHGTRAAVQQKNKTVISKAMIGMRRLTKEMGDGR